MMNRDESRMLLRTRSGLTSQPYSESVIDDWHAVLEDLDYLECSKALKDAARRHDKVTPAHVIEHLPRKPISTQIVYRWQGPSDEGRALAAEIRAHLRGEHTEPSSACPTCTAVHK
jgi:hypothetical protein